MSLAVVFALVLSLGGGGHPAEACSQGARISGVCVNSTVDSGGATIGATTTTPGQPGGTTGGSTSSGSSSATTGSSGAGATAPRFPWTPPPPRDPVLGSAQCSVIIAGSCRGQSPPKNPPATAPVTSTVAPAVVRAPTPPGTASELASFAPGNPRIVIEPGSWSLPRVVTNIYSTASGETQSGQLLGWPIEVRFTPQVFRWAYGDGATARHTGRGGSWGSNQFQATSTGHVYRSPGTYNVTLSVEYAVSYRFDGGAFVGVPGTVTRQASTTSVTVLRVSPVLVESGCAPVSLVGGRCG
jgi:hypothetical protein